MLSHTDKSEDRRNIIILLIIAKVVDMSRTECLLPYTVALSLQLA